MGSERTPRIAAYTWSRQWKSEVCTGLVAGATSIAAFVAMRSLHAPEYTPQLIAIAGQAVWLFAPGLEAFTSRLDGRRAFVWLGLLANVPLMLLAFLPVAPGGGGSALGTEAYLWFLAAIVLLTALDGLYVPLRGALLRANYPESVRGRYFGWLSAVSKVGTVVSSKFGGVLLGADPRLVRVYYPLAGVAGLVEHVLISRIRWHRAEAVRTRETEGIFAHFVSSLREGFGILRHDRDFRIFEGGFLLYGLGFLMGFPLVTEFAEGTLHLSYAEVTWAEGVANPVAFLVVALVVAPMLPRLGVLAVTSVSFFALSAYFVSMAFVETPVAYVALSFLFGAVMAGVNLGWNLGPLRFAPPGRARAYGAVHLLMVGVRIVIGPLVGYLLSREIGLAWVFRISAVLIALGGVTMGVLARRIR